MFLTMTTTWLKWLSGRAHRVFLKEPHALALPLIAFTLQDIYLSGGNLDRSYDADQQYRAENAQEEMAKWKIEKLAWQI